MKNAQALVHFKYKRGVMKKLILTCVLLSSFLEISAQRVICPDALQKYKETGLWSAEAFAGPKDWSGWVAGGGVLYFLPRFKTGESTKYLFPNKFFRLNGFYLQDYSYEIKHKAYGVDLMFGFTPFNISDVFYGSILAGGTYSSDRLTPNSAAQNFSRELTASRLGALLGAEVSAFLSRSGNLSVVGSFTQRTFSHQENWGKLRWYATLGIRYHFITMRPLNGAKFRN